jgi:hypothetical protein
MKIRTVHGFVLVLLVMSGCASGHRAANDVDTIIDVTNNLIPPTTVSVILQPRAGIDRNLGEVFSNRTQALHYVGMPLQGEYQLIAEVANGRRLYSVIVVLTNATRVHWDLQRNFIDVTYN